MAPKAQGPVVTIDVPPPDGADLPVEAGIRARKRCWRRRTRPGLCCASISPRVWWLGGDCGVDLAPFAYMSERYGEDFAVLWTDAHPDVMDASQPPNAHAMVLAQLLGEGDPEFLGCVPRPLSPGRVMYAGLYDMSPPERAMLDRLGVGMATPGELRAGSGKVLDWLRATGAKQLAIHFDQDVLEPAQLRSLYFSRPDAAPGAFDGIPQGRMAIAEVLKLVTDVAAEVRVVGLGITEYLPWDAAMIRAMLGQLPLLDEGG